MDEITLTTVLYDRFHTCVSVKAGARKCVIVCKFMNDVNFDSLTVIQSMEKNRLPSVARAAAPKPISVIHTRTHKHTPVSGIQ